MWPELLDNLRAEVLAAGRPPIACVCKESGRSARTPRRPHSALDAYKAVLAEVSSDPMRWRRYSASERRAKNSAWSPPTSSNQLRSGAHDAGLGARAPARRPIPPTRRHLEGDRSSARRLARRPADAQTVLMRALAEIPSGASSIRRSNDWPRSPAVTAVTPTRSRNARRASSTPRWPKTCGGGRRHRRNQLKDDRRAIQAYVKAGEQMGDDPGSQRSTGFTSAPRFRALGEIIERRVGVIPEVKSKPIAARLAKLQIGEFQGAR